MTGKSTVSVDIFKILKKAKLIGDKYKGLKYTDLTAQQRGYITRTATEFKAVIQNPANFVIRKVKSADTVRDLKKQGFKVSNGRAVIRADFDGKVSITTRTVKKDGERTSTSVVRVANKFEGKVSYDLKIQDLVLYVEVNKKTPLWILSVQSQFKKGEQWACSIGGKPIGDNFEDIDSLLYYFEDYLEKELGAADAAKCVLMRVENLKITTNDDRKPRGKEIKLANSDARKQQKFRF